MMLLHSQTNIWHDAKCPALATEMGNRCDCHSEPARVVVLPYTDGLMLEMLAAKMDAQPPEPDPQLHDGRVLGLIAREYDEWQKQVDALRLLLGVRIVNAALDQGADPPGRLYG